MSGRRKAHQNHQHQRGFVVDFFQNIIIFLRSKYINTLCPFANGERLLFRHPKAELQRPSAENRAGNHTAHAEKHNHKKADIHHRVHKACEQSDDRHNKPEKRRQL